MIPVEIVVGILIGFLVWKIVLWWHRAHDAAAEADALRAENAELRETTAALTDKLTNATRPAQSTKP